MLDMETAIRRAVMPLAKRGLRTIEQKSGRSIGIEYACRRYIMDQLGALDDEVQKATMTGWGVTAGRSAPTRPARQTMSRSRAASTVMRSMSN